MYMRERVGLSIVVTGAAIDKYNYVVLPITWTTVGILIGSLL